MVAEIVEIQADHDLSRRVCGEYKEMPGLRLTLAQACRLWNTDAHTGVHVLDELVARAVLRRAGPFYVRVDSGA